ncbi:hypothetical protein [Streptomyces sp. NPDC058755]|uniref:hypothetical protein n=1 Tax=unclassified Streptomyces TaxID=2593676 RepID=UPI00367E8846
MTVVAEYASGLVRTQVLAGARDGHFTWVRGAGRARPGPLQGPPPAARNILAGLASGPSGQGPGVRCVLPRANEDGTELHYPVPGRRSMAETLLSGDPRDLSGAEETLYDLGRLLRALHSAPVPAGEADACSPPGSWRRLHAWFDAPRTGHAEQLHSVLGELLGADRRGRIERWLHELPEVRPLTPVHGAPGLGLLVPAVAQGHPHGLLTGEDVGRAAWQWDVGWVVAELHEMRFFAARVPGAGTDWEHLAQVFLRGYGRAPDAWVRRCAVLRSLLHLHDFSVFVTWDVAEVRRYAVLLASLVDAEGDLR